MAKNEDGGIKSAYELAMERLEQKEGKLKPLTDEQKAAIAEADSEMQAKIAQIEITMDPQIAQVRMTGDEQQARDLEAQKAADLERARTQAEDAKKQIRNA